MTPQEFGELIRAHREAKGLHIADLASRFKLSANTLRSIEAGDLDYMPHVVYARGFVRSYAQAVGVSPEDLDAGIEALFPAHLFGDVPTVPSPIDGKPARVRRGGDKIIALALVFVLLILPVGAGWYVLNNYGGQIMDVIKRPLSAVTAATHSAQTAGTNGNGEPTFAQQALDSIPGSVPDSIPGQTPANPPGSIAAIEPPIGIAPEVVQDMPTAVPQTQERVPAPIVERAPVNTPVSGKQVSILAREECWVQATVDGAMTRSFTVHPGETSLLPYKRKITLILGNAGGVDIAHNGKPYAMNGRPNERRTVEFQ